MEPYGNIEPVKVSADNLPLGRNRDSRPGLLSQLGGALLGTSQLKIQNEMHKAQMLHEVNMAHLGHQHNLELINSAAQNSMSIDQLKHNLGETAADTAHARTMEADEATHQRGLEAEEQKTSLQALLNSQESELRNKEATHKTNLELVQKAADHDREVKMLREKSVLETRSRGQQMDAISKLTENPRLGSGALSVNATGGDLSISMPVTAKPKPVARKKATKPKATTRARAAVKPVTPKLDTKAADAYND